MSKALVPFLRLVPEDPQALARDLEQALLAAEMARGKGEWDRVMRAMGQAGNACWMLGRCEEGIAYLESARTLAGELKRPHDALIMKLRLGIAWQYHGDGERAETILSEALTEARALAYYEDFALQHLGKLWVEAGRPEEARSLFERALQLRQSKGDSSLIRSTQEALDGLGLHCQPEVP